MLFPKSGKKKKKGRLIDKEHLRLVSNLPCCCCGIKNDTIVPHHLLRGVTRGMGMKAGDNLVIPLCHKHHEALHRNGNETVFLAGYGVNGLELANALYLWTSQT